MVYSPLFLNTAKIFRQKLRINESILLHGEKIAYEIYALKNCAFDNRGAYQQRRDYI